MIIPENIIQPAITLSDGYFDLKGLEAYSSIKVPTLRDYIKSGSLPCFKLKGKILIRKSEFDAWIEEFRHNRKKELNSIVDEVLTSLKAQKSKS